MWEDSSLFSLGILNGWGEKNHFGDLGKQNETLSVISLVIFSTSPFYTCIYLIDHEIFCGIGAWQEQYRF